ncbi:MAG TPA: thiosulfate sulfurtransferase GlpE [Pyrinomonadaceae bacterium]|nr:thiosulfate sulfurtransferase GlpE [Pyrinomonadaceae bacterium]
MAVLLIEMFSISVAAVNPNDNQKTVGIDLITVDELKVKVAANEPVLIIDVRSSESYANSNSKIKGAIHVNVRKLKYRLGFAPLKEVPRDREVITYCACPSEESSILAAQVLLESGFKRVRALKGGWVQWQKASGPIEPRK